MPAAVNGMKKCTRCGEIKPVSEFHNLRSTKDGLKYQCKVCCAAYNAAHRDKMKEYNNKYRNEHSEIRKKKQIYDKCVKHPNCTAVGSRGCEFVIYTCVVCGKEFRRRKAYVDWQYEHRGTISKYCSIECQNKAYLGNQPNQYSKNIKRIRKEQNL